MLTQQFVCKASPLTVPRINVPGSWQQHGGSRRRTAHDEGGGALPATARGGGALGVTIAYVSLPVSHSTVPRSTAACRRSGRRWQRGGTRPVTERRRAARGGQGRLRHWDHTRGALKGEETSCRGKRLGFGMRSNGCGCLYDSQTLEEDKEIQIYGNRMGIGRWIVILARSVDWLGWAGTAFEISPASSSHSSPASQPKLLKAGPFSPAVRHARQRQQGRRKKGGRALNEGPSSQHKHSHSTPQLFKKTQVEKAVLHSFNCWQGFYLFFFLPRTRQHMV